jgi:hypothetical protein
MTSCIRALDVGAVILGLILSFGVGFFRERIVLVQCEILL